MAITGKLTVLFCERIKKPGKYGDGGNLYLDVKKPGAKALEMKKPGSKSWLFRYMTKRIAHDMGLGAYGKRDVSLVEARDRAADYRKLLRNRIDPIEERDRLEAAGEKNNISFKEAAEACIKVKQLEWKSPKSPQQWHNTLRDYVYPIIGHKPVRQIDLTAVLKCLQPVWETKTETASRVRGRVEAVLDWATVKGYRTGDNPARWKGNLDQLLGKPGKVAAVRHHAALPYEQLPAFITKLQRQPGVAAQAVLLAILTAVRSSEARGATWDEIDLDAGLWTIPKERMKAGRGHRVLLSTAAVQLLQAMQPLRQTDNDYIFPGLKRNRPLSDQALTKTLRRMGVDKTQATVHGFRSSFRDWVAEKTHVPAEVAEMALAHKVANQVEAAYRRGDLLEKRRKLMESWAQYCFQSKGKVVLLRSGDTP